MNINDRNRLLRFVYYCLVFLFGMATSSRRDEEAYQAINANDAFGNEAIQPTPEMEELMPVHGLNRRA